MAEETLNIKKTFDIKAHVFLEKLKEKIHATLDKILTRYDRPDLKDIVYTILKELVINATKANIKRIIFAEHNLDIDNPEDWKKGTAIFKEKLRECFIEDFSKKTKSLNLIVKINYVYNKDGMRAEVTNNTPIPKIDEKRMRELLSVAMQYDSISDFYLDVVEGSKVEAVEGGGMGLAMIIIILKNNGFDPKYLRIGTHDEKTVARVEIPFTDNYVPYRDAKHKEKIESEQNLVE